MKAAQRLLPMLTLAVTFFSARAQEFKLPMMVTGASVKIGGFIPQHIELSGVKPAGIKKEPAGLIAPLYGELKMGPVEAPSIFYIIVDEPAGAPARLYVDANANGDFSDDATCEWKTRSKSMNQDLAANFGGAMVKITYPEVLSLHVAFFRYDPKDSKHANAKNLLFYYSDYARIGVINLNNHFYQALLADRLATGDFRPGKDFKHISTTLFIDINGDGKFDLQTESFRPEKTFRLEGMPYEFSGLTASGDRFNINVSKKAVEEANATPGVQTGDRAPAFEAQTLAGAHVSFPTDYRGKIVMLDFWATWCGPCRAEMPNVIAAYQKYHAQGFELLGVSLDQAGMNQSLGEFLSQNQMSWPQIYAGKFWEADIARLYNVSSIPQAVLIDGDSGLVLGEGSALRGKKLEPAIVTALASKKN